MTDGAEEDGVEGAQLLQAVGGHHAPGLDVGFAAPIEFLPAALETETAPGGFDNTNPFGNDFLTDAVTGNDRDFEGFHRTENGLSRACMAQTAYKSEAYLNVGVPSRNIRKVICLHRSVQPCFVGRAGLSARR